MPSVSVKTPPQPGSADGTQSQLHYTQKNIVPILQDSWICPFEPSFGLRI